VFGFGRSKDGPANPVPLSRDAAGAPAVDLAKVRDSGHISLAKAADSAGIALSKRGLAGMRAQGVLVLDHSGSMQREYQNGSVQTLVERVLGYTLQIDADGTVPVIAFDHRVHAPVDVTISNYENVVDLKIWQRHGMGSTNLAGALAKVRDLAAKTKMPMYVPVITDGDPDDPGAATEIVCDLARYPVFLKFLALRPVPYLSTLDTLGDSKRLIDNCNAQPVRGSSLNLLSCSDLDFQEAMADEWDAWTAAALKAGVVT
jgi:hypothetical protein